MKTVLHKSENLFPLGALSKSSNALNTVRISKTRVWIFSLCFVAVDNDKPPGLLIGLCYNLMSYKLSH